MVLNSGTCMTCNLGNWSEMFFLRLKSVTENRSNGVGYISSPTMMISFGWNENRFYNRKVKNLNKMENIINSELIRWIQLIRHTWSFYFKIFINHVLQLSKSKYSKILINYLIVSIHKQKIGSCCVNMYVFSLNSFYIQTKNRLMLHKYVRFFFN